MKYKLGQETAFPLEIYRDNILIDNSVGMSKRFYVVCAAMQGYLSNNDYVAKYTYARIVEDAYIIADELLKQEDV